MRRDEDEEFIATPKNLSAMVGQEIYEGPFVSLGRGKHISHIGLKLGATSSFLVPFLFSNASHGDLPKDHQGRGV